MSLKILRGELAVLRPGAEGHEHLAGRGAAGRELGEDARAELLAGRKCADKSTPGFDHMEYWRRSMFAATAARVIASRMMPRMRKIASWPHC